MEFRFKFLSSGKIMYICGVMMDGTEEGNSQNILLKRNIYICKFKYKILQKRDFLVSMENMSI